MINNYFEKGKKYRSYDGFGNHWDIVITGTRTHPEGYLWVEYDSMKNDSGNWNEDGNPMDGFINNIEKGITIEVIEPK